MIAPDPQLQLLREQLGRMERALEDLHREVHPRNEQLFRAMAEGYVDQIAELRLQIDRHLGVASIVPSVGRAASIVGDVREIDLDEYRFLLRGRGPDEPELLCEYDELLKEQVAALLGKRVRVKGWLRADPKSGEQSLEVDAIEPPTPQPAAPARPDAAARHSP